MSSLKDNLGHFRFYFRVVLYLRSSRAIYFAILRFTLFLSLSLALCVSSTSARESSEHEYPGLHSSKSFIAIFHIHTSLILARASERFILFLSTDLNTIVKPRRMFSQPVGFSFERDHKYTPSFRRGATRDRRR